MWIVFILIGLASGTISGLLGIGGGVILVPALLEAFRALEIPHDLAAQMAVGTSLGVLSFTTVFTAYRYHSKGFVEWGTVKRFVAPLSIGAATGMSLNLVIPVGFVKLLFAVFSLHVAYDLLFPTHIKYKKLPSGKSALMLPCLFGICSGLVGVAGGVLIIPYLHQHGFNMKTAAGTSSASSTLIAITGASTAIIIGPSHFADLTLTHFGFVHIPVVIAVAFGSFLAIPLGFNTALRLPDKYLKSIFASLLIMISLRMIYLGIHSL